MKNQQAFLLVPKDELDEIKSVLNDIKSCVNKKDNNKNHSLGEYISEKEAQEMLNRKTTWFWQKRKSGQLTGKKAGNQWFYHKKDIISFIEQGIME